MSEESTEHGQCSCPVKDGKEPCDHCKATGCRCLKF